MSLKDFLVILWYNVFVIIMEVIKVKSKFFSAFRNRYFCYLCIFLIVLFIHSFFSFMNDDVTFFSNVLNNYRLFDYINERYLTWTSRVIIEGVLVNICRNIYLWRIFNSLIITLLIYTLEKIFNIKKSNFYIFFCFIIFLLYPYYQMAEAGFGATTLNYLWPLAFLLYSFIPFQQIYRKEKVNNKLIFTYILAFTFACNQEQAVCVGMFSSIVFLIYCIKNNKDIKYPLVLVIISILSIIFILMCPGNDIRRGFEIIHCYPDYINANFLDKLYLGIVSTCSILISNFLVILLFSVIIFIISVYNKNKFIKLLSFIQLIVVLFLSLYRVYIFFISNSILDAYTYGIFYYVTDVGHVFNFSFLNIIILFICVGMVIIYCVLLYSIFKSKSVFPILTILVGCASRLLMGFSPTIFASGSRTMIFMYFSILCVIILLKEKLSNRKLKFIGVLIIIFIIVNYILTFKAIPLIENL